MKNENTKNNVITWNSEIAVDYACRAKYSMQEFAQIEKITNATEASIVLKTLDVLADNAELIRAKVLERMQEIKDFGTAKNIKEWAVSQGIGRSTVYKYIDTATLINADAKHSIAPEREDGKDYTYSRLKVFAERVKPFVKEKASKIAKMSAKEKKEYYGDDYEALKNSGVDDITRALLATQFTLMDADGRISPDMPIKQYNAAIDAIIGKAIIDDAPVDSTADTPADSTADAKESTESTAEKAKSVKLTAEEWGAIVALCNRIKAGESVTELPADVVKVLTAHA